MDSPRNGVKPHRVGFISQRDCETYSYSYALPRHRLAHRTGQAGQGKVNGSGSIRDAGRIIRDRDRERPSGQEMSLERGGGAAS